MIGDGMGPGQLAAASHFAHGRADGLFMQNLPSRGQASTASLSGLTDSAASATTLATGVRTYNAKIGLDRFNQPAETLVEWARRNGLRSGIVSTSSLPHATPGAFSAHKDDRGNYLEIANDQALNVRPDVMLGGGERFYLPQGPGSDRTDQGLLIPLMSAGYQVARTRAQLLAVTASPTAKVVGVFAPEHLDYVKDRTPATTQPTLTELSMNALRVLEPSPNGFFLMIEGARIDMASHLNDLDRAVGETIAFDQAIAAVSAWGRARGNVTLIVTADHECGGLTVTQPMAQGVLPQVTWRWLQHTNARVSVFGEGPGTSAFHGQVVDHAWIHALMLAQLSRQALVAPPRTLVPDGRLSDLRHSAATQRVMSGYGVGFNQLDRLWIDADRDGFAIGVEGLFKWSENTVVLLVDVDYGASTGPARLQGALTDTNGVADDILSSLSLDAPMTAGFGADFAIVSHGGLESRNEDLLTGAGLRALSPPNNLGWLTSSINFGENVRTTTMSAAVPGEGLEAYVPWSRFYPSLMGRVPVGATIAVAAILVNDDGGHTSNQALPPFLANTMNPGRVLTRLPGLVTFKVDSNNDGLADGMMPPMTVP